MFCRVTASQAAESSLPTASYQGTTSHSLRKNSALPVFLEGRSFSCAVQVFYFRRPEATSVAEGFVFWGFFSSLFSGAASQYTMAGAFKPRNDETHSGAEVGLSHGTHRHD